MYELAAQLIHLPVMVPMDISITPNDSGLPDRAAAHHRRCRHDRRAHPERARAHCVGDRVGLRIELLEPAPRLPRQGWCPRLVWCRGAVRCGGDAHQLLLGRRPAGLSSAH